MWKHRTECPKCAVNMHVETPHRNAQQLYWKVLIMAGKATCAGAHRLTLLTKITDITPQYYRSVIYTNWNRQLVSLELVAPFRRLHYDGKMLGEEGQSMNSVGPARLCRFCLDNSSVWPSRSQSHTWYTEITVIVTGRKYKVEWKGNSSSGIRTYHLLLRAMGVTDGRQWKWALIQTESTPLLQSRRDHKHIIWTGDVTVMPT